MVSMKTVFATVMVWAGVFAASMSRHVSSNSHLSPLELPYLEGDPKVTHKVIFEISERHGNNDVVLGEMVVALFGELVPKTVMNFVHLANLTYGFGYKGNNFHRVIKNFMIQAGALNDPKGRQSIYNDFGAFDDENFELLHDKFGRVSMANAGPNTNGAGFFITNRDECGWLDGKHVVFGQVTEGLSTIKRISNVETQHDDPVNSVFISYSRAYNVLPEPITYDDPSSFSYSALFLVTLVLALGLLYKRSYYKKQRIRDLKDDDYY